MCVCANVMSYYLNAIKNTWLQKKITACKLNHNLRRKCPDMTGSQQKPRWQHIFFYCIKVFFITLCITFLFFYCGRWWLCTAKPTSGRACLCVCECVSVFMMDVFLLSFEARCILDGIRRRLKKTGSSLSASPPLSLSLSLAVWWCVSVRVLDKRIERLIEMDEGILRER